MNWYRLEAVRDTLRLDYASAIGKPNVEAWRRVVGGHIYFALLNYESEEMLVPEGPLLLAAESIRISPREFRDRVKRRGGLWPGPNPVS